MINRSSVDDCLVFTVHCLKRRLTEAECLVVHVSISLKGFDMDIKSTELPGCLLPIVLLDCVYLYSFSSILDLIVSLCPYLSQYRHHKGFVARILTRLHHISAFF